MSERKFKEVKSSKKVWNNRANTYDDWYKTFRGAVENYVDWELLKGYLPKNKNAKILDAAGGTGRITLPLAKMGYSITLCDISPVMLDVAKQKMLREGVSDKVKILECDICNLNFSDELFDFVLCWDGFTNNTEESVVKELIRVTRKGGMISIFLVNKWVSVINNFFRSPNSTFAAIEALPSYLEDEEGRYEVFSPEEAKNLFEKEGIRVIDIYAVCGWMNVLPIPENVLDSTDWDEKFFKQTTEMVLKLSKEPSVKGMSKHLVLYGEKM
jgi:ubiquinone/menaquinone biosynthesis C-methylase UbiE